MTLRLDVLQLCRSRDGWRLFRVFRPFLAFSVPEPHGDLPVAWTVGGMAHAPSVPVGLEGPDVALRQSQNQREGQKEIE